MGPNTKKRKRAAGDNGQSHPSKRPTPTHIPQSPSQATTTTAPRPSPPSQFLPSTRPAAKAGPKPRPPRPSTSLAPHAEILAALESKYAVLAPFVLSSTKIRARVTAVLAHLQQQQQQQEQEQQQQQQQQGARGKAPVAMLHARAGDVCKMITVAEQVKRLLGRRAWWQYNEMFEPEPKMKPKTKSVPRREQLEEGGEDEVVEETVLLDSSAPRPEGEDDEDEDDGFEVIGRGTDDAATTASAVATTARFEDAVIRRREERRERSLRIFLALAPVPELGSRASVTVQMNPKAKGVAA